MPLPLDPTAMSAATAPPSLHRPSHGEFAPSSQASVWEPYPWPPPESAATPRDPRRPWLLPPPPVSTAPGVGALIGREEREEGRERWGRERLGGCGGEGGIE